MMNLSINNKKKKRMKKIVKLTENDLARIVKRIINETSGTQSKFNKNEYYKVDADPKNPKKYCVFQSTDGGYKYTTYECNLDLATANANKDGYVRTP
jgi:hypothetical protein